MTAEASSLPPLDIPQKRPRVIPVLLLRDGLLYKPRKFKSPKYVGDPRVAVKIFNDKGADELVLLDISTTETGRSPDYDLIEEIVSESFMPVAYGGGISQFEHASRLMAIGVEKVVLNSILFENPNLSEEIAGVFGAQSVVGCLDCRKRIFGSYAVYTHNGSKHTALSPREAATVIADRGVGEIIVQSILHEGIGGGYDTVLIQMVSEAVDVPVIALGGASELGHFREAIHAGADAVAAGSMFVFTGPHRAVLITYPPDESLHQIFGTRP